MSISRLLLVVFLILVSISSVRALWPRPNPAGSRTPLVWVTGSNPTRQEQFATFNQENPDLYVTLDVGNADTQKIILQCSSGVGPDIYL